jgi:hypothetical protein
MPETEMFKFAIKSATILRSQQEVYRENVQLTEELQNEIVPAGKGSVHCPAAN